MLLSSLIVTVLVIQRSNIYTTALPSAVKMNPYDLNAKRNSAITAPAKIMPGIFSGEGLNPVYLIVKIKPIEATKNSVMVEMIAAAVYE